MAAMDMSDEMAARDPGRLTTEELRMEVDRLRRLVENAPCGEDEFSEAVAGDFATEREETESSGDGQVDLRG